MKLRSILLLAGFAMAGVTQAQTVYTVTGVNLNTFDATAPAVAFATVPITGLTAGDIVIGLDRRPANNALVLAVDGLANDRLYTLNPISGQATLLSTLAADPADLTAPFTGLTGAAFGTDFNPVPDRLRVVSDTGQNLRINVDSGLVTTDLPLNGATASIQASAYINNFPGGGGSTTLYGINGATDTLYTQVPPNDGTQVVTGPLGVDTANTIGLDILTNNGATTTNTAYAGLFVGGFTNLYTVNLTSGAATLVGRLGSGAVIQGFAVVAGGPGGAGPSGIPAIGINGLVLLGLLLGAFAIVVIRQSR